MTDIEAALILKRLLNHDQPGAYDILTTINSTDLHILADVVDTLATMIDEIQIERGR